MLQRFLKKLTIQEAFETDAQINEELKIIVLNGAFCQKIKLLIDRFLHFLTKRRNSVEKIIHQKRDRGHRSYSNGHLPYHLLILLLGAHIDV